MVEDIVLIENLFNLEEELLNHIQGREDDVQTLNLPQSDEYVMNSRSQKIHIREYLPENDVPPRAMMIFIHGYNAHINRPMFPIYAKYICDQGYSFVTFDLHSHGYSDGNDRVLIEDGEDLLDDIWCILQSLYTSSSESSSTESSSFNLKHSTPLSCPFIIIGQSLGGAINIDISQDLMDLKTSQPDHPIASYYMGSMLLCPAVTVSKPHPIIISIFEYILLPLFPRVSVPSFATTVSKIELGWIEPSMTKYIKADAYPIGLTYNGTIRFQTAFAILRYLTKIEKKLSIVNFPFLVLHDPEDHVVSVSGTLELMRVAMTSDNEKKYVVVEGGRHDLFHNKASIVLENIFAFMKERLGIYDAQHK